MSAEPLRTHTLDWCDRMAAWRFEDHYRPHKAKNHKAARTLVHAQLRDCVSRTPDSAMSINSKPSQRVGRPQSIAALAEAEIFGGEK